MRLDDGGTTLKIRFKLEAIMGAEATSKNDSTTSLGRNKMVKISLNAFPRAERNHIALYYLPAKREPLDQIRSGTGAFGRIVGAVDWAEEGEKFDNAAA